MILTQTLRRLRFQSTPLMRGETRSSSTHTRTPWNFNPLPSCEGRLSNDSGGICSSFISIHSPHARGDISASRFTSRMFHFNPLPSCEGRLFVASSIRALFSFQSTPLMRGETRVVRREILFMPISIHSPHARGDVQPTRRLIIYQMISIHSPHARGDSTVQPSACGASSHFNPLPSCEGRQHKPPKIRLDSRQFIQQNHHSSFF